MVTNKIPVYRDEQIVMRDLWEHIVGEYHTGITYYGYIDGENFGIATSGDKETGLGIVADKNGEFIDFTNKNLERNLLFSPEDSLMLLKSIYRFSHRNGELKNLYQKNY